jgi:murein endopeptidase
LLGTAAAADSPCLPLGGPPLGRSPRSRSLRPLYLAAALAAVIATWAAAAPADAARRPRKPADPPGPAIGHWNRGALVDGEAVPLEGEDHYLLYPPHCYTSEPMRAAYPDPARGSNFYAHPLVVKAVLEVARAVRRAYPDAPRVPVGELSNRVGGPIPFHRSHQNGLDVDIFLLLRPHAPTEAGALGQDPARIVPVCRDGPNLEPRDPRTAKWRVHRDFALDWNWALTAAYALRDDVKVVFLGDLLRRALLDWARREGCPATEIAAVEAKLKTPVCQRPGGVGKVAWKDNFCPHDDHLHIRFRCPRDSRECRGR